MAFDTHILDQALAQRRARWEQERQVLLQRLGQLLDERAADYGVTKAYLFGSLVQQNRFSDHSDVDVAVESIDPQQFFAFASMLSSALGREVDLISLKQCHFADVIQRDGVIWTAAN